MQTMLPTNILSEEHRVIEQALACLDKMTQGCLAGGKLNPQHARDAIAFFRNFADRCHHGKEEAHLFPLLEARGFPREGGPTGVMIHEHEEGRAHVRAMDKEIESATAGDKAALRRFTDHAQAYIHLLSEHIHKEDLCLFAMANQAFSPKDQQTLLDTFERVEREEMGEGTHEKFLKIANDLADAYHVPRAQLSAVGGDCGCSHHKH